MKMWNVLLLILGLASHSLSAQDAFHTSLQAKLESEFGVSGGNWLFFNNEADKFGKCYSLRRREHGVSSKRSGLSDPVPNAHFNGLGQSLGCRMEPAEYNCFAGRRCGPVDFFCKGTRNERKVNFFAEDATTFNQRGTTYHAY